MSKPELGLAAIESVVGDLQTIRNAADTIDEDNGSVSLIEWLDTLPDKALAKCRVRLERLQALGHELRRPEADYLRDDIYELRVGLQGRNFRMLYFFHGREVVVVSHGLVKKRVVPPKEIDLAVERKAKFETSPATHTYTEPGEDDG